MSLTLEIARKELRTLLYSPSGWLLLAIIALQLGTLLFGNISSRVTQASFTGDGNLSLTFSIFFVKFHESFALGLLRSLYLYIPLVTMTLLSYEYSRGTIKLLFSSPLKIRDIVLGKFVSILTFALFPTLLFGAFAFMMGAFMISGVDVKLVFGTMLVLYLVICTYGAIGLFVSSLTAYPLVAALGSVAVVFSWNFLIGFLNLDYQTTPRFILDMVSWFSGMELFSTFGPREFEGYLFVSELLFFVIMMTLFLGLTALRLHFMRQSLSFGFKARRYAALVAVCLMVGMLSVPLLKNYYLEIVSLQTTDTRMIVTKEDLAAWRTVLLYVIPLSLVLVGTAMVISRRRS